MFPVLNNRRTYNRYSLYYILYISKVFDRTERRPRYIVSENGHDEININVRELRMQ